MKNTQKTLEIKEMQNTFSILYYLSKVKEAKARNKKAVIYIRITVCGDDTAFSTQLKVHPDRWSQQDQRATGKGENITSINLTLANLYDRIERAYNEALRHELTITPLELKETICPTAQKKDTFLSYFKRHNEFFEKKRVVISKRNAEKKSNRKKSEEDKTFKRYVLARERFKEFLLEKYSVEDISFYKLNSIIIEEYELFLRDKYNLINNTAMKFMQKLRTVVIYARKQNNKLPDPFIDYDMHWEKSKRKYLTIEEIIKLMRYPYASDRLKKVRDVFIFSCFTGLAYAELAKLSEPELINLLDTLWIKTDRDKTAEDVSVPVLDIPHSILKKYDGKLPVISNQKMNDYLKEIAAICDINKNLTCHVGRHTFATLALTLGVPIESVSKMLGHTNIVTTQIYAKIVNTKVKEDMQKFAVELKKIKQLVFSDLLKAS